MSRVVYLIEPTEPRGYPIGTKRLCLDTDYYATCNRTGPGSPSVLSNMVVSIEQHVAEVAQGTLYPEASSRHRGQVRR